METGTYLTEIGIEKETSNHLNEQQKFKRFSQSNLAVGNLRSSIPDASSNCFRLNKKSFNQFLPQDYYESKRVKPGISFYRLILEADERRKTQSRIPSLKLNIPETLILSDNSFQMLYSENNKVKVKEDMNHLEFPSIVQRQEGKFLFDATQAEKVYLYPASLLASGNGTFLDFSVCLSSELDSRIYPKNQNQVSIRYPYPFSDTPNCLRLYYIPRNVRGAKPSHGYKLTNKKILSQDLYSKKHKLSHNYLVDASKKQIVVTPIKGKALSQLEEMAQSIINLLEYLRKVKINQIVVDFIYGEDRIHYFHEIKSIKSVTLTKMWDIGETEDIVSLVKEKNNQIHCRLCGFLYSKAQMTHLVTKKLIIQLISHLKNRGEHINILCPQMAANINTLSDSSHVCQLCYSLIIAQHQLIDLEHQFCSMLNMNSDSIHRVPQMFSSQIHVQQPLNPLDILNMQTEGESGAKTPSVNGLNLFKTAISTPASHSSQTDYMQTPQDLQKMPKSLYQWRMFFFVQKIKNIPNKKYSLDEESELEQVDEQYNLSFSFNDMHENFKHLQDIQVQEALETGVKMKKQKDIDSSSRLSSTRVQSAISASIVKPYLNINTMKRHLQQQEQFQDVETGVKQIMRPATSQPGSKIPAVSQYYPTYTLHTNKQKNSKHTLDVRKVKLVVFYTTTPQIKNVLANQDLKFQLTKNTRSKKSTARRNQGQQFKMKGESSTLQNFSNKKGCQRHSCEILLFDQGYTYCNLQLNIGIICDGNVPANLTNLKKSSTDHRVYFPDRSHRNCNPLPEEWIEVLTGGVQQCQNDMEQSQLGKNSRAELRQRSRNENKHVPNRLRQFQGFKVGMTKSTGRLKRPKTSGTIRPLTGISTMTMNRKQQSSWKITEGCEYEEQQKNGLMKKRKKGQERVSMGKVARQKQLDRYVDGSQDEYQFEQYL